MELIIYDFARTESKPSQIFCSLEISGCIVLIDNLVRNLYQLLNERIKEAKEDSNESTYRCSKTVRELD